jgi:hypothetical protein
MDGGAVTLNSFPVHAGHRYEAPALRTTPAHAFELIGNILFPKGYKPGYLGGTFQPAALHYSQTEDYKLAGAQAVAQFWEDNTLADNNGHYTRNDTNASSGGFTAFRTFVPHLGEATLDPEITIRAKNVEGFDREPEAIENSLTHELFHLRDIMGKPKDPATGARLKAPPDGAHILFADIANSASPIALTPQAKRLLAWCMEGHTAANTARMAVLRSEENPRFLNTLKADAMTAQRFVEIQNESSSLSEAITRASFESMTAPNWGYGKEGTPWSFGDYYAMEELRAYDHGYQSFDKCDAWNSIRLRYNEPVEFVDIDLNDPEDVAALLKIGTMFGKSPFEKDGQLHPDFIAKFMAPLKPEIEAEYARVEKDLGIYGKNFRGFSRALRDWGVTPQEYMAHTTGHSPPTKPFPFREIAKPDPRYQVAYPDNDYQPPLYVKIKAPAVQFSDTAPAYASYA